MDVITTHVNADFDCLGAMIAARHLYPEAVLVFPGGQERGLRDFLLQSTLYAYGFKRAKEIDLAAVRRLILVDVRHTRRIGPFAALVKNPDVELHIYDHHPADEEALHGAVEQIEMVGATTTVLTHLFMQRGIVPDADEATMMMLGIYEDTGNLLFASTTTRDYQAAAFLLEHGANLNTVADFLVREMTPDQVALLNDLLKSCRKTMINGVEVAVAHSSLEEGVTEIASLAHRLKDIESLDVLIMAVRMEDRIFVVARSDLPEVDVGQLLREFKGGGHPYAASATVRDMTLVQLLDRLDDALLSHIRARCDAQLLMSTPVKTLDRGATVQQARDLLTRYNFNALPVMDGPVVVGLVTRQTVERAAHHGFPELLLAEIMHTDFEKVTPQASLEALQRAMTMHNQRIVPVVDGDVLRGVVTRTDLLRYMIGDPRAVDGKPLSAERGGMPTRLQRRGLKRLLDAQLPEALSDLLYQLGDVGDQLGVGVFLVGGFVRDLLLRRKNLDIDLVIEGDGIAFAEAFAKNCRCRVRSHRKFGTAVLIFEDGFKIDVASARIEFYDHPAALPRVEYASLRHDLYRRDFSINTLTIALNRSEFGQLLDFFNGQRDMKEKSIRVLHNLSFIEDPTRVFRAIRFEQRLGFQIGKQTERLMRSAVGMGLVEKVGGARVFNELVQILSEVQVVDAIRRLQQFDLLTYIHPRLEFSDSVEALLLSTGRVCHWFDLLYTGDTYQRWLVNLMCLLDALPSRGLAASVQTLAIKPQYGSILVDEMPLARKALGTFERTLARQGDAPASELYRFFAEFSLETLIYLLAKAGHEGARRGLSTFIGTLRQVHPEVNGDDLRAMGLPPGPRYKQIFDRLRDARLDGLITDRQGEIALARQLIDELEATP
ncbi:MAG: polya polymerase [Desulfuromonas sp.]|nr:MAG: polya polymerase [Desulfuromonas sp.]